MQDPLVVMVTCMTRFRLVVKVVKTELCLFWRSVIKNSSISSCTEILPYKMPPFHPVSTSLWSFASLSVTRIWFPRIAACCADDAGWRYLSVHMTWWLQLFLSKPFKFKSENETTICVSFFVRIKRTALQDLWVSKRNFRAVEHLFILLTSSLTSSLCCCDAEVYSSTLWHHCWLQVQQPWLLLIISFM